MRWFYLGLLLCLLISCKQWSFKKLSADQLFEENWKAVSLNDVEVYPSFKACDQSQNSKKCFQKTILDSIQKQFKQTKFNTINSVEDTIWVHLKLDDTGSFCVDSLDVSSQIMETVPQIKKWLHQGVQSLPDSSPAYVQGIPVTTKFKLPIIIKTD